MAKMTEGLQRACLQSMEYLMARPCASMFNEPVSPDSDYAKDYFSVIKNPIDLGTIKTRLSNGEYKTIKEWRRDMNYVWGNAEKFNSHQAMYCAVAQELHRLFIKEYSRLKPRGTTSWLKVLTIAKDKLDELLESPPPGASPRPSPSSKAGHVDAPPFTETELSNFIKATTLLTSAQDTKKMQSILIQNNPHYNFAKENWRIDVNCLTNQTLHELRSYMQKRFSELGISYPHKAEHDKH